MGEQALNRSKHGRERTATEVIADCASCQRLEPLESNPHAGSSHGVRIRSQCDKKLCR